MWIKTEHFVNWNGLFQPNISVSENVRITICPVFKKDIVEAKDISNNIF